MKKFALSLLSVCACLFFLNEKSFASWDDSKDHLPHTVPWEYSGTTYTHIGMYNYYPGSVILVVYCPDNVGFTADYNYGSLALRSTGTCRFFESDDNGSTWTPYSWQFTYARMNQTPTSDLGDFIRANRNVVATYTENWYGAWSFGSVTAGDVLIEGSSFGTPPAPEMPLSFPLQTECSPGVLCTPYTAPISSVFDHSMATAYSENETVVAFTGDSGVRGSGYWYGCYRKADSSAFDFYGYTGANGTSYLCYDGHPAIDYDVDVGTAVYSTASGTVLEANYDNCLGYYVRIQHDDGYTTLYAHLDSINTNNVMVGELIQANVQIGESGNTGTCSSGSHLHFEVRLNNVPVDPYGWEGGGDDPYTQAVNIPLW